MNAGEQASGLLSIRAGGFEVDPPELSLRDVDLRRPIEVAHEFVHAAPELSRLACRSRTR